MKNNKKGFTIVELVIVIAIIAILAAVLIPTFANIVKKANESSDIQAVRNMNTHLAVEDAMKGKLSITDVYAVLEEQGLEAKDYKPLYSDRYFFYDQDDNRIVYTDSDYKVVFGENTGKTKSDLGHRWISLNGEIGMQTVTVTSGSATVNTAEELFYLLSEPDCHGAKTINIAADIDAMGANIELNYASGSGTVVINGNNHTLSNVIQNNYKEVGVGPNVGKVYISGFIPVVLSGTNLTVSDLKFVNCEFGDLGTGMVGIVGKVQAGTLAMNNVDIENTTFNGNNKVGSFIGWIDGGSNVTIDENCSLKNVVINSSKGESGKLVGAITNVGSTIVIKKAVQTSMDNVTLNHVAYSNYTIYRGQVTLKTANSSGATQELINRLSGIIFRPSGDFRPFSDNALYTLYNISPNGSHSLTINGEQMEYFNNGNDNEKIILNVEGYNGDITLTNKCWYIGIDLADN